MYSKLVAADSKIIYINVQNNKPLRNKNYAEAAEFLQRLFKIENNVSVRTRNEWRPSFIYEIFISVCRPLVRLDNPLITNTIYRLHNDNDWSRSSYRKNGNYIHIARKDNNPHSIIHETIVDLIKNKSLPNLIWLPRGIEISFMLIKLIEAGKSLAGFRYPYIEKGAARVYPPDPCLLEFYPYNSDKPHKDEYGETYYTVYTGGFEKIFFDGVSSYKNSHVSAHIEIKEGLKYWIEFFNENQSGELNPNTSEREDMGAFIAGIVKTILEETHDAEKAISFLRELIAGRPLGETLSQILGS